MTPLIEPGSQALARTSPDGADGAVKNMNCGLNIDFAFR
jgi:hypothetical protein